jgi:uncharacterized repeat protein (TIGR03847 family)
VVRRRIIDFDAPERFAPGTVGEPGDRMYYLQAVQGKRVVSVMVEQEQVAILAERLLTIIDELERRGLAAIDAGPAGRPDDGPLQTPAREEFRVGTMTIAWDDDVDQLVVEARSMTFDAGAGESALRDADEADDEIFDDAPIGPDVLRVRLTPFMAQRFARRAGHVAEEGRPTCPLCGASIAPTGHLCAHLQDWDTSVDGHSIG